MSAKYLKRHEAVFLVNHPKGPKLSYGAAAKVLRKSKAFVSKWIRRYLEVGNVDDFPERGLTRVTKKTEDNQIVRLFKQKPNLTLSQAKIKLREKGIFVSISTIRRRLQENNIAFRSTIKKPLLSEKHRNKRLAWAKKNLDRDWDEVIFTDESSFWAWSSLSKAWCTRHDRWLQRTVKHPVKVHVWGCFSKRGFGCLYLFTDNLNAQKMCNIYQKYLLRSAKKLFGSNETNWVLQEDNDPKHRSQLCTGWKKDNGIITMDWPAMSPDANPIENIWSYMKMKLKGKPIRTLKQLSYKIKTIWRSLPREYAEILVESMPKRCQAIIDNDGEWINY